MLLDRQRVKKVKTELGLTDAAKFCGFVIHIPGNDEFIARIEETPFSIVIGYTPVPYYAIKYSRYDKAVKAAKKCDKYTTVIGYLFDLADHYYVGINSKSGHKI